MKKNLETLLVLAAASLFAIGCSEERSVAPADSASPTESSSDDQTDDGAATEPAGSSSNEAGSGL